jgi:putative salt-induced outer membrane protein YdiY
MRNALFLVLILGFSVLGETKPEPDVLILNDGERLIGHLLKSSGASLTFKSDMAGTVTVDWSKVKELQTYSRFAVIPKNVRLARKSVPANIPQGTLTVADEKVEVKPVSGAPQTVPVADAAVVVPEDAFEKAIGGAPGFFHEWKGGITGGVSFVEATQDSQTFTAAVNLVRVDPSEDWLERSNRTTFDFNEAYGKVTQPDSPEVKTSIYHFDGERDEYFSARFYGFGELSLDHNFSQGLNLQQQYGGGIGRTVVKGKKQQLDVKAGVSFIEQNFSGATRTQNLFGSTFADVYVYKLPHGMTFNQALTITPAWNNTNALSGLASAGLIIPTYKRLATSLNAIDTYLHDPPVGFKKNSVQISAGLTYAIQ